MAWNTSAAPLPARQTGLDPTDWVIYFVIVGTFLYHLAFNFMPDVMRPPWYGALFLGHVYLTIQASIHRQHWAGTVILLCVGVLGIVWATAASVGFGYRDLRTGDAEAVIKNLLVFLPAVWIFAYPDKIPLQIVKYLAVGSIVFAVLLAIVMPPINASGIIRWYYVTGLTIRESRATTTATTPHSAAYFMMFSVIIVDQFRRHGMLRWEIALPVIAGGLALIWGYQVRTAFIMIAIYWGVSFYTSANRGTLYRPLFWLAAACTILYMIYFFYTTDIDIMRLGSGRVGNWLHRYDLLKERSFGALLFGHGIESDFYVSYVWKDEPKEAHNDILHFLLESGIIGLSMMLLFLYALHKRLMPAAKASFWAGVFSSCISNGILAREAVSIYWYLSLVVATGVLYQYNQMLPRPDIDTVPEPLSPVPLVTGETAHGTPRMTL